MESIEKIVELAVSDRVFRERLLEDPSATLRERGITLEPDQIAKLEAIAKEEDIGVVSDELNERLAKVSEVERSY
jgi:hypothetical protein